MMNDHPTVTVAAEQVTAKTRAHLGGSVSIFIADRHTPESAAFSVRNIIEDVLMLTALTHTGVDPREIVGEVIDNAVYENVTPRVLDFAVENLEALAALPDKNFPSHPQVALDTLHHVLVVAQERYRIDPHGVY